MNVNIVANNAHKKVNTSSYASVLDSQKEVNSTKSVNNTIDSLEISEDAYKLQSENENITATSGKDYLGITRSGKNDNTFVIHFTDSAQVSRTIDRGYLVINGNRIELSDDVKDTLMQTDKQAQEDRESAYYSYILQLNMDVAKQQGETYKKMAEDQAKAMEIARRIAKGGKVPGTDEKKLMEFNPAMYAMAKSAEIMAKTHKQYDTIYKDDEKTGETNNSDTSEWKAYETQMSVSMDGTPQAQEISETEIDMTTQ